MESNKLVNALLIFLTVILFILVIFIFVAIFIQLRCNYIDLQLKERLLYSEDSCTQIEETEFAGDKA